MTDQKVEDRCGGGDPVLGAETMDERPKYRALGRLVLEPDARKIEAGEEVVFEGTPHAGLMPLNAPARRTKLRFLDAHWRENRPQQISRLARSLGYVGTDGAEACAFIDKFISETEKETTP
jgi:hypothetical protein